MRNTAGAATFRIYHQQRVKHPSQFFGEEIYPLYIRVTYGTKSLNFKSHCFEQLLKAKYQNGVRLGHAAPGLDEVVQLETELIEFLISKHPDDFSLSVFKKEYDFYTYDLLDKLDEDFKRYLVSFFFREGMPSIAYLLENQSTKLTADLVLDDLKRSLSQPVYDKMIQTSLHAAPPYIPLLEFYRSHPFNSTGMLLAFQFHRHNFESELDEFIRTSFPDYRLNHPQRYVSNYLKNLAVEH